MAVVVAVAVAVVGGRQALAEPRDQSSFAVCWMPSPLLSLLRADQVYSNFDQSLAGMAVPNSNISADPELYQAHGHFTNRAGLPQSRHCYLKT